MSTNEAIEQLSTKIDGVLQKLTPLLDRAELFGALAKAQSEMRAAKSNKENRYLKAMYEDLESIVDASRIPLTKNGLSVMHIPTVNEDGSASLKCILAHSSGQYIESTMRMLPVSNDPQALGSCFTYLKRQSYAAMTGVVAQQEDDDGEYVMHDVRTEGEKGTSLTQKYNPQEQSSETISRDQLDELEYELAQYPDMGKQIMKGLRIISLADMPKSKYRDSIDWVRRVKAERNGSKR